VFKYARIPKCIVENIDSNFMNFVFLSGKLLCPTCSQGQEIYNLSENKKTIFIVPLDFSGNDIDNFKNILGIRICFSAVLAEGASLSRFSHQSSCGIINHDKKRCQGRIENARKCSWSGSGAKRAGNHPDSSPGQREDHEKYSAEVSTVIKTS